MGKLTVTGLDAFMTQADELNSKTTGIIKQGVYDGAKILADELHDAVSKDIGYRTERERKQVEGLEKGLGVSKMRTENGVTYTVIGFAGYNDVKTEKYPNGQPNVMIASSINNGTSWGFKRPFIKNATKRAKDKAIKEATNTIKQGIENIQKKG